MNSRLGDLGLSDDGELPSWALESDAEDEEQNILQTAPSKEELEVDDTNDNVEPIQKQKKKKKKKSSFRIAKSYLRNRKKLRKKESGESDDDQVMLNESFFKNVDLILDDIDAVRQATKRVRKINDEALLTTSTEKEEELSHELNKLITSTSTRAKGTKDLLEALKECNSKLKGRADVKASDLRLRENLCYTLMKKLMDEMKLYQAAQQKYKNDIKEKVRRQVRAVQPGATDSDIEAVMNSGEGRDAHFQKLLLYGKASDAVKYTYEKVTGKYQDVLALEASVSELHQMFLDLALLTEQQGELLDQIEFQVLSSAEHVEAANDDMKQSIEYQKRILEKKIYIMVIVAGVVVYILLPILI